MTAPTVVDLFRRQARSRPGHPAVVHPAGTLTYADLDHASDLLARALADRGLAPVSPIPVLFDRSPALYIALLGVLKAGAAYFPLHPADPPRRLRRLLRLVSARCLLTDTRPVPWLPDPDLPVLRLGPLPSSSPGRPRQHVRPAPSDLAYVMPTSGSSGGPKGVMVEHRSVGNLVQWAGRRFQIRPGDRVAQCHAPTFDASVQEIFGALARLKSERGLAIVLVEQNARAAFRVADEVVVMDRGQVAATGTPQVLARDDRVQSAYLGGGYAAT